MRGESESAWSTFRWAHDEDALLVIPFFFMIQRRLQPVNPHSFPDAVTVKQEMGRHEIPS